MADRVVVLGVEVEREAAREAYLQLVTISSATNARARASRRRKAVRLLGALLGEAFDPAKDLAVYEDALNVVVGPKSWPKEWLEED